MLQELQQAFGSLWNRWSGHTSQITRDTLARYFKAEGIGAKVNFVGFCVSVSLASNAESASMELMKRQNEMCLVVSKIMKNVDGCPV